MMYSGGMPILYPFACVFFFVYYWLDKILMIKYFRKPPQFDNYIALHMLKYFKWILLFHIAITFWMFLSKEIFTSQCSALENDNNYDLDHLGCKHIEIYMIAVGTMFAIWLILTYLIFPLTNLGKFLDDE